MYRTTVLLLILLVSSLGHAFAGVISSFEPFTKNDRVLILAPHPDDEAIATGGVIQAALKAGASVRVVLLTSGENNELSFIVYKKRPVLRRKELLAMGEVRYGETVAAVKALGLEMENVVALGYPDYGTMDVMTGYWGSVKPFRSMLSRVNNVPYDNALTPHAPYVGESILNDLKQVLLNFQPTKIFVSHPADTNRDHRALYLFLKVALWDIDGHAAEAKVLPYIVHVVGWPKPRGYSPEKTLEVPEKLAQSEIAWSTLELDELAIGKKYEAIKQYVSQNKYAPKYLVSFARKNEIFGDYPDVPIVRQMASQVVWQYVGTGDEGLSAKATGKPDHISSLAYARQGNNLLVRLILKRAIDQEMGVSIFLLGYKAGVPFGEMPKINLLVGLDGLHVKDRRKSLSAKEIQFTSKDRELVFSIPLSLLGSPEKILGLAKTSLYDLTLDETAWRTLLIK